MKKSTRILSLVMLLAFLFTSLLGGVPAAAAASDMTINAPQRIVGYFPYYRYEFVDDIDFSACTHVILTFINCKNNVLENLWESGVDMAAGTQPGEAGMQDAVNKIHAAGSKAMIAIGGGMHGAAGLNLSTPELRTAWVNGIMDIVNEFGFDGVDLDIEEDSGWVGYSEAVRMLKEALGEKELSCATSFDYMMAQATAGETAAWQYFDFVGAMAYDATQTLADGHILYGLAMMNKIQSYGVDPQDICLGVPFYYYDGTTKTWATKYGEMPSYFEVESAELTEKIELSNHFGGIMIWEIGQDIFTDPDVSLLNHIKSEMTRITEVNNGVSAVGLPEFSLNTPYSHGTRFVLNGVVYEAAVDCTFTVSNEKYPFSGRNQGGATTLGDVTYIGYADYTVIPSGDPTPGQLPVAPPVNLQTSNITEDSVSLSWSVSSDSESYVLPVSYNVYESNVLLGTVSGTNASVIQLTPGMDYSFKIQSVDANGRKSASVTASITAAGDAPQTGAPDYPEFVLGNWIASGTTVIYNGHVYTSKNGGSGFENPPAAGSSNWAWDYVGEAIGAPERDEDPILGSTEPVAPTIITSAVASGKVGKQYSANLNASGSTPIVWSAVGLPSGLTLSSAGVLSGVPTEEGSFTFTVTADNDVAPNATKQFSITINPADPPEAPSITTLSLASGTVGKPYNKSLAATGTDVITWSFTGTLPAGLSLSSAGVFSGTPTAAGSYNIEVTATNAVGSSTPKSFNIVINEPSAADAPKRIVIYAPWWRKTETMATDFTKLTHVNVSFVRLMSDGNGGLAWDFGQSNDGSTTQNPFSESDITAIVNKAHQAGKKAIISFGGFGGHDIESMPINDPTHREYVANVLFELVDKFGFDGIDMDFETEYSQYWENYGEFTTLLRIGCDARGIELSMAVSPWFTSAIPNQAEVLDMYDFLNIMSYDVQYRQDGTRAGIALTDHSPLWQAYQLLDYYGENGLGIANDKLTIGTPFYYYNVGSTTPGADNWGKANSWFNIAKGEGDIWIDNLPGETDANAMKRVTLTKAYIGSRDYGGICVWEIGQDQINNTSNSLLHMAYDVMNSDNPTVTMPTENDQTFPAVAQESFTVTNYTPITRANAVPDFATTANNILISKYYWDTAVGETTTVTADTNSSVTWQIRDSANHAGIVNISQDGTIQAIGEGACVVEAVVGGNVVGKLNVRVAGVSTPTAPVITTLALTDGQVGDSYSQQLRASGTQPIVWSATGLPAGLSINSATGVISGTPTEDGSFTVSVTADNSIDPDDVESFTLVIAPEAAPVAPTITTSSLNSGKVGVAYLVTLSATGDDTIAWSAAGLPAGLSINSATGVISGTPSEDGSFTVSITADNNIDPDDVKSFTLVIAPADAVVAPVITTNSLSDATVGSSYSGQLSATGTGAITWSVVSGNLPAGLTLSSDGVISGTPTTAQTATFTVQASNGSAATKQLTITVAAASQQPSGYTTWSTSGNGTDAYGRPIWIANSVVFYNGHYYRMTFVGDTAGLMSIAPPNAYLWTDLGTTAPNN